MAPSAGTHHPVRAGNLRTYKPLEHQHVPEIDQALSAAGARDLALRFVPVSAPLGRGILATAFGALDNLVKGGAGQAIENMNLMLGLDEKASLADPGPWPP